MSDTQSPAVNKVIYLVLTAFLGALGVHKFYAGKTVAGVLYLLFSWTCIPAILAIIDFIIGVFKSSDAQGNIRF